MGVTRVLVLRKKIPGQARSRPRSRARPESFVKPVTGRGESLGQVLPGDPGRAAGQRGGLGCHQRAISADARPIWRRHSGKFAGWPILFSMTRQNANLPHG